MYVTRAAQIDQDIFGALTRDDLISLHITLRLSYDSIMRRMNHFGGTRKDLSALHQMVQENCDMRLSILAYV